MSIATVTVQIGNSDNKLTQEQWAAFIAGFRQLLAGSHAKIHFFGFSASDAPWQNCCAVIDEPENMVDFEDALARLAWIFNQDDIALTAGITQFVEASNG